MINKAKKIIYSFLVLIISKLYFAIPTYHLTFTKSEFYLSLLSKKLLLLGANLKCDGRVDFTDEKGLIIGENVRIGSDVYFRSESGIVIGDNSIIGSNTKFFSTTHLHTGIKEKSIYIGKNVLIEPGCIIMPGTNIKDNTNLKAGTILETDTIYDKPVSNELLPDKNNIPDKVYKTAIEKGKKLFFIVSTGRSGSQTICTLLNQHKKINCLHEPRIQLTRLSTEYENNTISEEVLKEELLSLYNNASVIQSEIIYGESNQKLSNMIYILAELFPLAKFIWLIRDGKKVVNSTHSRGWFGDEYLAKVKFNKRGWNKWRLNGSKVGVFTNQEWENMSPFERNCWYWSYWNLRIKQQLTKIDSNRWLFIKLENLNQNADKICEFLDIEKTKFAFSHSNKSKKHHVKTKNKKWTKKQKDEFEKHCASLYNEHY